MTAISKGKNRAAPVFGAAGSRGRIRRAGATVMMAFLLLLSMTGVSRAEAPELMTQAERIFKCAWISLASYSDRVGLMARQFLAYEGYVMEPVEGAAKSQQCFLMRQEVPGYSPRFLLSIPGTENRQDLRTDFMVRKVPFDGENSAQFAAAAARSRMTSREPLVHAGFNDYCQQVFFTAEAGEIPLGERLAAALKADPDARLCVTGHSLGGAVSVLLAARLMAMGVPPDQMAVVTFGAPAVGNAAFADAYGEMPVERVVMTGDPMRGVLQLLQSGYTQFGEPVNERQARGYDRFPHEMVGYLDAALRRYYDDGEVPQEEETPRVYLAAKYTFPELLEEDVSYCRRATQNLLRYQVRGLCVGDAGGTKEEICQRARAAGCDYVLMQTYEVRRDRNAVNQMVVTMTEGVFDSGGALLGGQASVTSTRTITPLLATLYDAVSSRESRLRLLGQE